MVRKAAARDGRVRLTEIALGDKCGAWNTYVHEIAPPAEAHLFLDGDMRMDPGAGPELYRTLLQAPDARAAIALPVGGRNEASYRKQLLAEPSVWGNLYALRDSVLRQFREQGIRLPLGHIGDDGLIGYLVDRDLDPRAPAIPGRTVAAERATVRYSRLRWFVPRDIRLYWRRRVSYSVRHFQFQALGPRIKTHGVEAIPASIVELYGELLERPCPVRPGLNLVSDRVARRRMKRAWDVFQERSDSG